ncbi:hypothetical protein [Propionivibrio sp.]|uniref:hypothetical protein n=1 Tax=Propionivibrio sp. TaxID=2212460 RepID=UPI0025E8B859|nr:hypothetical protein [Propionivibrio sp.]MBK7357144.1 hypothetical protein [Propionivibrio sp.]
MYSLVLQKGYREGEFSVVYPLARGTGPLFAVFGAIVVLNESPSFLGWLGIFAVLTGIALMAGAARVSFLATKGASGVVWGTLPDDLRYWWAVKTLGVARSFALGLAIGDLHRWRSEAGS